MRDSVKILTAEGEHRDFVSSPLSSDYTFAVYQSGMEKAIISQTLKEALGIVTLSERVTLLNEPL